LLKAVVRTPIADYGLENAVVGNWGFDGFPFATYRTVFAIPTPALRGIDPVALG